MRGWHGLALAVLAIALGLLALAFFQNYFIFHPARALDATPDLLRLPYEQIRLKTADGQILGAWLVTADEPAATVLFLHGNAGNRSHRLNEVASLRREGLSVFIIDYRGYAESTGRPSEQGLHLDARAAWDFLTRERGIAAEQIVLYGESLGSVPALELARTLDREGQPGPAAIILEGAFTSALEVGRRAFPYLPVRLLLRAKLDNLTTIRDVAAPTLFLHGERDEVSPIEMGRRLFSTSPARLKVFHEVPGAWHNTLWTSGGTGLYRVVREFITRALADGAGPASG